MNKSQLHFKKSIYKRISENIRSPNIVILILLILLIAQITQNQLLIRRLSSQESRPILSLVGTKINMPDLPTIDGNVYTFSQSPNMQHLIIYFHTDCTYCHIDMPLWKIMQQNAANRNINVVAITDETDKNIVTQFAKENQLTIPIVIDSERKLLEQLKANTTPIKFLVSSDRQIVQVWRGLTTQLSEESEIGALVSTFGIEPQLLPANADLN